MERVAEAVIDAAAASSEVHARAERPYARDVHVRFRRTFWRSALAFVLVAAAAGSTASMLGIPLLVAPIALVMFSLTGLIDERHHRAAARRALAAVNLDAPMPHERDAMLSHALRNYATPVTVGASHMFGYASLLPEVAKILARSGGCGCIFRLSGKLEDLPPLDTPLRVPIEPTALGAPLERDDASPSAVRRQAMTDALEMTLGGAARRPWARWLYYALLLLGILAIGSAVFRGVKEMVNGQVPSIFESVWVGFAIIIPFILPKLLYPKSWFLLPASLVVRTATWTSSKWTLHQFMRTNSVVVYWREFHQLAVARNDGVAFVTPVAPRLVCSVYRAWASPLEPPPLDRLSDLQ